MKHLKILLLALIANCLFLSVAKSSENYASDRLEASFEASLSEELSLGTELVGQTNADNSKTTKFEDLKLKLDGIYGFDFDDNHFQSGLFITAATSKASQDSEKLFGFGVTAGLSFENFAFSKNFQVNLNLNLEKQFYRNSQLSYTEDLDLAAERPNWIANSELSLLYLWKDLSVGLIVTPEIQWDQEGYQNITLELKPLALYKLGSNLELGLYHSTKSNQYDETERFRVSLFDPSESKIGLLLKLGASL